MKNGEVGDKVATDEQAFNETLKRMLKTPPNPHSGKKRENDPQPERDKERPRKTK